MKLKFKPLSLGSGRPIAFISKGFAEEFHIPEGSRIEVLHKGKKLIIAVNIVKKLLTSKEISFSDEAIEYLKIKKGRNVDISPALQSRSSRFVLKKLNNKELNKSEIFAIVRDIVNNALNEAEIAYFVSGVYNHGMNRRETIYLTEAMAKNGKTLKWNHKMVGDKHSIGGVAGNRTTPIVVAICAAAGIIMPKTSSRAITSAAGTADVIEVIARVDLSLKDLKKVVKKTNACLAWGGSLGLAPADDKIIRVERLLNVDPEPQLIASIISKKISAGSNNILIDIPYGKGAKVSLIKAKDLEKKFIDIGKNFKLKIKVVLTSGSEPIGNGIGPILEMRDVLKVLSRKNPPKDLEKKSIFLAGQILEMMNVTSKGQGEKLATEILESKRALKKFNQIVDSQGRKKTKLRTAKFKYDIKSKKKAKIKEINNKKINRLARILGCPTTKSAGVYLYKHVNDKVEKDEKIFTIYSESKKKLTEGKIYCRNSRPIIM